MAPQFFARLGACLPFLRPSDAPRGEGSRANGPGIAPLRERQVVPEQPGPSRARSTRSPIPGGLRFRVVAALSTGIHRLTGRRPFNLDSLGRIPRGLALQALVRTGVDLKGVPLARLVALGVDLKGETLASLVTRHFDPTNAPLDTLVDAGVSLQGATRRGLREQGFDPDAIEYATLVHAGMTPEEEPVSIGKLTELVARAKDRAARDEPVDLAALLERAGYSRTLERLSAGDDAVFQGVSLKGIEFSRCALNWAHFESSALNNVTFRLCQLTNVSFVNAGLTNCRFDHCRMREVMLTGAALRGVTFTRCGLLSCSFEDASLHDTHFDNASLPGTHFLGAEVSASTLSNCTLKDTAFFGCRHAFMLDAASAATAAMTRPATAVIVDPQACGMTVPLICAHIDLLDNVQLRVTSQPQRYPPAEVRREVEEILGTIAAAPAPLPIPQALLQRVRAEPQTYPNLAGIVEKARQVLQHVDSLVLPGGEDVPPALYAAVADPVTQWGDDYRRGLFELALFHQATQQGVPLMAVCRGFQLANVYHGARLLQDIAPRAPLERYELEERARHGLYGEAMRGPLTSVASHHQGVPAQHDGTGLIEAVVIQNGLAMASEHVHGATAPAILLQFHPEFHLPAPPAAGGDPQPEADPTSPDNLKFWSLFAGAAQAYRHKKAMLMTVQERAAVAGMEGSP